MLLGWTSEQEEEGEEKEANQQNNRWDEAFGSGQKWEVTY